MAAFGAKLPMHLRANYAGQLLKRVEGPAQLGGEAAFCQTS